MKTYREVDDSWNLPLKKKSRTDASHDFDSESCLYGDNMKNEVTPHMVSSTNQGLVAPRTPPASRSASPLSQYSLSSGTDPSRRTRSYCSFYSPVADVRLPPVVSPPTALLLPSLEEFEKGVRELIRFHGPSTSSLPPSLSSGSAQTSSVPGYDVFKSLSPHCSSSMSQEYSYYAQQALNSSTTPSPVFSSIGSPSTQYAYPSPPPDDSRHINKKYSVEEGDFIIYQVNDKKKKWASITREFATRFGNVPERTTSGLQAWYYRTNNHIPVWNEGGWLIFNKDEDEGPRTVAIKCRSKASEFGLAQRYPERLMEYEWADEISKREARDWATKRNFQYRERAERQRKMAFRHKL